VNELVIAGLAHRTGEVLKSHADALAVGESPN